ncbi:dTDP-4-dehydrorhamnose reductase [Pseudonocardia sp. WMMC193]|uniref:dTDP-4-dehydrorhamnose reductase n=1 Tax=Pseudonocardia sp. WMMC193 TaxID=2911965 RepID=UPI001F0256CE|nr:dTDP-4-dehydrorhamnose reductase [Pseudonocardia sp. WMMC193]MCF7553856.1 dTDP-4-dehydrorhamnose reductase [Pseudonocardia sp. WMMC193]
MRAIILGANGQLGRALSAVVPEARALARSDLDLTDAEALATVDWSAYDTILNAAAYTKVDAAETAEGRRAAWAANATGPAHLARIATEHGLRLVHVSTEYVFDGTEDGPLPEDAAIAPLSVYGASKAAGDAAVATTPKHWIVRPTWVMGDGANFARTMRTLAERGVSPTVVADQVGRPTLASDLAAGMLALLDAEPGTYHLTNSGSAASWAEVARFVFEQSGRSGADVADTTTAEYFADKPAAAPRPLNSVLDLTKAEKAGVALPDWRESLERYLR